MSRIRSSDTRPEIMLRKALWAKGFRYRKNYKRAEGSPDIAFVGKRIAIFIDGSFWHGYEWECQKQRLKSNREYWIPKIERNMERDRKVNRQLRDAGWTVIRFWDFEVTKNLEKCVETVSSAYRNSSDGEGFNQRPLKSKD